ncbi:Luciferase family protein [Frankia canadensis]|uniref:Luciferase family protein n=1 Tax=Frankia canadensis TaxID=1836972 RepID=A0A2I2KUV1_9ACTN|nr:LLM class flavin-dependent oxidoreductase [Frankia canadensis]SNQ49432.1 Luciferase family protein [Frankia canadensis]SOU56722.1 Luciferase family protein [Frankia canadensis]
MTVNGDIPAAGRPGIGFLAAPGESGSLSDFARTLEDAGADSLWASGHITIGRPVPEPLTSLAHIAAVTTRVRVGSAVFPLPLYNPMVLAKQLAEIDRLSGGRVSVGVGTGGEYQREFDAVGVPRTGLGPRLDEQIGLLRAAWADRSTPFRGALWQVDDARVEPSPAHPQGPPILVAGRKNPAMRRAARLGDGWMPFLYTPEQYARSVAAIHRLAGPDRDLTSGFEWLVFVYVSLDDDAETALSRAISYVGAGQAGDPERFTTFVERVAAFGPPKLVAARLQEFLDAGARHLILAPTDGVDPAAMAADVLSRVAPLLRVPA